MTLVRRSAPLLAALVVSLVVLGPALGPGVVLAYDLVWSPDPRWTPFVLGLDTPAPRVLPSDAVAVLLGTVLTPGLAQALVLLTILILVGTGAAALVRQLRPQVTAAAEVAAVIAAVWNPFVYQRLVVGQWTVLLGLAVLPWLLRSALRLRSRDGSMWSVLAWLAVASLGGANSLVLALFVLPVLAWPPVRWRHLVAAVGTWLGGAAVWAVPALAGTGRLPDTAATEFLPRADTPVGVVLSLVSGGGFWNTATHAPERSNWIIAGLATALVLVVSAVATQRLWRGSGAAVVLTAVLSLALCVVSVLPLTSALWSAAVGALPGGGLLRDSQKFLAAWVVFVAIGLGVVIGDLLSQRARRAWVVPLVVLAMASPVALLPSLAWGVSNRVQAVEVPGTYRDAAREASSLPPGEVGLLPWGQYRRYEWNGDRVSLTVAPRIIDQPILFDDSLPLLDGRVAGEDPRAALVSARIDDGVDPGEALVEAGVVYVAIEPTGGLPVEVPPGLGTVVVESTDLVLLRVTESATSPAAPGPWPAIGWLVSGLTWSAVAGGGIWWNLRRSYSRV